MKFKNWFKINESFDDIDFDFDYLEGKPLKKSRKQAKYTILNDELYVNKPFLQNMRSVYVRHDPDNPFEGGEYVFWHKNAKYKADPYKNKRLIDIFKEPVFVVRPLSGNINLRSLLANAHHITTLQLPDQLHEKPIMKPNDPIKVYDSIYMDTPNSPKVMDGKLFNKGYKWWVVYPDGRQEELTKWSNDDMERFNYNFIDRVWEFR